MSDTSPCSLHEIAIMIFLPLHVHKMRPGKLRICSNYATNKRQVKDMDLDSLAQNPFFGNTYFMVLATESQRKDANLLKQNDFQSTAGEQNNFIYSIFPQTKKVQRF